MAATRNNKRIRLTLLALLWAWGVLMFLVVDLFKNVPEFERARPRAALYEGMRAAAHEMVGEPYNDPLARSAHVSRHTRAGVPADGKWSSIHENGQLAVEGEYLRGQRVGAWTSYHENGAVANRENLVDGVPHGEREAFHDTGEPSVKGRYVRGRRDGRWQEWHPSGKPSVDEEYIDGRRHGAFRMWHEGGQLAEEGSFLDGVQEGPWTSYSPTGQTLEQGEFRNNRRDGRWLFWDPQGKLLREEWHDESGLTRTVDYRRERHPLDAPGHAGVSAIRVD